MKRIIPVILLLVAAIAFGTIGFFACSKEEKPVNEGVQEHVDSPSPVSQNSDKPVQVYCGNTLTTITIEGKEYTFWGSDSVALTDLLLNLDYSKDRLCKCMAPIRVNTEFGSGYGINLVSNYARSEKGQASLTDEQVELITGIIERQCENNGEIS